MTRAGALALLLTGCGERAPVTLPPASVSQTCSLTLPIPRPSQLDALFVVDDSSALATALPPRLAAFAERLLTTPVLAASYHIGVVTADPVDGWKLRGGCGLGGDRAFLEYDSAGGLTNLAGSRLLADTLACLFAVGNGGAAAQQPISAALGVLRDGLPANHDFFRSRALLLLVFAVGADHADPAVAAAIDFFTRPGAAKRDPYDVVLASVAPPSPTLHAVVASVRDRHELAPDGSNLDSLLFGPLHGDTFPACLSAPVRDAAHPDCSVIETDYADSGAVSAQTPIERCDRIRFARPCWTLEADARCPSGQTVEVWRPPEYGATPAWREALAQCDCSPPANPVAR